MKTKYYYCDRCKKPILQGRALYTLDKYGQFLCGSQQWESYCEKFRKEELKSQPKRDSSNL